jgi:hypothetical protein
MICSSTDDVTATVAIHLAAKVPHLRPVYVGFVVISQEPNRD